VRVSPRFNIIFSVFPIPSLSSSRSLENKLLSQFIALMHYFLDFSHEYIKFSGDSNNLLLQQLPQFYCYYSVKRALNIFRILKFINIFI